MRWRSASQVRAVNRRLANRHAALRILLALAIRLKVIVSTLQGLVVLRVRITLNMLVSAEVPSLPISVIALGL